MQYQKEDAHKYDDMLQMPHHVSGKHPQMPMRDRAAQFAPFAALTGHEEAIRETARETEARGHRFLLRDGEAIDAGPTESVPLAEDGSMGSLFLSNSCSKNSNV